MVMLLGPFSAGFFSETFRPLWRIERKCVLICATVFSGKELLMLSHSKVSQLPYERQIKISLLPSPCVSVNMHANDVTQNIWTISIKLCSQIYTILSQTFSFSFSFFHLRKLNLWTHLQVISRQHNMSAWQNLVNTSLIYIYISIFL